MTGGYSRECIVSVFIIIAVFIRIFFQIRLTEELRKVCLVNHLLVCELITHF